MAQPEDRVPFTPGRTHNRIRSPSPEPVGYRWTARAAPAARAGRMCRSGDGLGAFLWGLSSGVKQPPQNVYGHGNPIV
ncbi:hypothetical protein L3X38_025451 [Prunus dulcis]|uniref:Uncharacterized protein n=1 Tax=Prunus dulcis TaxID=3755 RepID=A0AAD4Z806_PRUDU|nr:hypothetical protein L3X38_025451 [Prunus dulcis]